MDCKFLLTVEEAPSGEPMATLENLLDHQSETYPLGYELCALADAFGRGPYHDLSLDNPAHPYHLLQAEPQNNVFAAYKFLNIIMSCSPDTIPGQSGASITSNMIASARKRFTTDYFDIFEIDSYIAFVNLMGYSLPRHITEYYDFDTEEAIKRSWSMAPEVTGRLSIISSGQGSWKAKEHYYCDTILDVVVSSVYHVLKARRGFKRCHNCGLLFISEHGNKRFCDRPSPQYPSKTCAESVDYARQRAHELRPSVRIRRSLSISKGRKVDNAIKHGPDAVAQAERERDEFRTAAKAWEAKIKAGQETEDRYIEWLDSQRTRKRRKDG